MPLNLIPSCLFVLIAIIIIRFFIALSFDSNQINDWKTSKPIFEYAQRTRSDKSVDESTFNYCYKESSIIFLHLTDEIKEWNPLEICAFKSAALINNDTGVCILTAYEMKPNPSLESIPNLEIAPLNAKFIFQGTPLQKWYHDYYLGRLVTRRYAMYHLSDALRYVYLFKFGGYYLDSDVLTLRKFTHLRNVAGWEHEKATGTAVLFFKKNHPLIKAVLEKFLHRFKSNLWAAVGPLLLKEVILNGQVDNSTFRVLDEVYFYPTKWWNPMQPFDPGQKDTVTTLANGSYSLHLYRKAATSTKFGYWKPGGVPKGSFVQELCNSFW